MTLTARCACPMSATFFFFKVSNSPESSVYSRPYLQLQGICRVFGLTAHEGYGYWNQSPLLGMSMLSCGPLDQGPTLLGSPIILDRPPNPAHPLAQRPSILGSLAQKRPPTIVLWNPKTSFWNPKTSFWDPKTSFWDPKTSFWSYFGS